MTASMSGNSRKNGSDSSKLNEAKPGSKASESSDKKSSKKTKKADNYATEGKNNNSPAPRVCFKYDFDISDDETNGDVNAEENYVMENAVNRETHRCRFAKCFSYDSSVVFN